MRVRANRNAQRLRGNYQVARQGLADKLANAASSQWRVFQHERLFWFNLKGKIPSAGSAAAVCDQRYEAILNILRMEGTLLELAWQALFDDWMERPVPCIKPRAWKQVVEILCNAPSFEAAAYHLANRGLRQAADLLRDYNLRDTTEERRHRLSSSGWTAMTPWSKRYPPRLRDRLGRDAPPMLWSRGYECEGTTPGIAIVGSRALTTEERQFALAVGQQCARLDYQVFSGGAVGADTLGLRGAGVGLHFLPGSPTKRHNNLPVACRDPEGASFDRIEALRRNRWVCAASVAAVVVASRLNRGGSWHTAVGAIRSRLCPVFAYLGSRPSTGNAALVESGAHAIRDPSELGSMLASALELEVPLPFQNE